MSRKLYKHFLIYVTALFLFLLPATAMAKGIYEHQNTLVPAGQTVDDVVVVGGDAVIQGIVDGPLIVVNGNADVKASAKINGFVLVLGGELWQEKGAVISDEVINLSLDSATQNSLMLGGGMVIGSWMLQLATSIFFIVIPQLVYLGAKRRVRSLTEQARISFGRSLIAGFFGSLIAAAVFALLFVSIIGIPIAVLLLIMAALVFAAGITVLSRLIGERIRGSFEQTDWMITLLGSAILVSFMNVPLVGFLLVLCAGWFSLGLAILQISDWVKKRRNAHP